MANFTVDTAADIPSQNGAANWWDSLFAGTLPTNTGGGNTGTGSGLSGLFGANAPTGPSLPAGTVSPISDMFSQVPTGLANNPVTYQANNVTSDPGQLALPTGSQWTPKPGFDIVYGVRQGAYGWYQIPSSDLPNALQKYGIQPMGQPLTQQAIDLHNNPSGQTPSVTTPSTPNGVVTTGATSPVTTIPTNTAPTTSTTPSAPALPELTGSRQSYLTAIDNYLKSQRPYATVDDSLRRAFNLPGQAELQMNQQANPQANPSNFVGDTAGMPFIPGSAPPQGFKWMWADPDGTGGNPGNYALAPQQDFFNALPGSNIEDLQTLANTYNDPTYANKYLPNNLSSVLGDWGRFLNVNTTGQGNRASLAPMESINLLAPMIENPEVKNYLQSLMNTVGGQLGSQYSNFNIWNNLNNPSGIQGYLGAMNSKLGLNKLPSLDEVLSSYRAGRTLENKDFFNDPLDFYTPQGAPPAFFQYLLEDRDGASGAAPSTYSLRLGQKPNTQADANSILETLNAMKGKFNFANLPQDIFTAQLGMDNNPIYSILNSYKFPGGTGAATNTNANTNQSFLSTGQGAPGGAPLPPVGYDTMVTQQSGAQERAARQAEDASRISLYGGGGGTGDLTNTTPPPGGTTTPPPTSTTPPGPKPDPFAGINAPATSGRPPKFYSPWSPWT